MKILKTLLLISTLVFAAILWATKMEWLPSQSAFALSDNVHWYYLMHGSIIATFVWDYFTYKRPWSMLVAILTAGIVLFDMYAFPITHNIMTGAMAVTAVGNLIYYAPDRHERGYAIMNCGVGALFFLLGLLVWDVHLFLGEAIIELAVGVAMARRIWGVAVVYGSKPIDSIKNSFDFDYDNNVQGKR